MQLSTQASLVKALASLQAVSVGMMEKLVPKESVGPKDLTHLSTSRYDHKWAYSQDHILHEVLQGYARAVLTEEEGHAQLPRNWAEQKEAVKRVGEGVLLLPLHGTRVLSSHEYLSGVPHLPSQAVPFRR